MPKTAHLRRMRSARRWLIAYASLKKKWLILKHGKLKSSATTLKIWGTELLLTCLSPLNAAPNHRIGCAHIASKKDRFIFFNSQFMVPRGITLVGAGSVRHATSSSISPFGIGAPGRSEANNSARSKHFGSKLIGAYIRCLEFRRCDAAGRTGALPVPGSRNKSTRPRRPVGVARHSRLLLVRSDRRGHCVQASRAPHVIGDTVVAFRPAAAQSIRDPFSVFFPHEADGL